jgi:hypothetical protein
MRDELEHFSVGYMPDTNFGPYGRPQPDAEAIRVCVDQLVAESLLAYEGPERGSTPIWTMENDNRGHEQVHYCPIYAATPPELKDEGPTALRKLYCYSIGQEFYALMGCTIEQDSWPAKGQPYCGYKIERRPAHEIRR